MKEMIVAGNHPYPKIEIDQTMAFLNKLKGNLPPIKFDNCLEKAAIDHLVDITEKGIHSHTGSDESTFKTRIEKYALWGGAIYETILYHEDLRTHSEILIDWLVDDGYEDKPNRKHALGEMHKVVGIAFGPHSCGGYCTVIVYGDQIIEKESKESE